MSLEDLIRQKVKRGELTHLSLIPTAEGWSASYSPASVFGHHIVSASDPIDALTQALQWNKNRAAAPPEKEKDPWE